jgi:hypothetical protein
MEAASFISAIFAPDDVIEFRMLPGAFSRWCKAGDFDSIWSKLVEDNRAQNVYFGPNPRTESGKKTDADTKLARCVWVDIDNFDDLNFVLSVLSEASLPAPSFVIASGGGFHVYWMLDEPLEDLARWTRIQKGLIQRLKSNGLAQVDGAIHNPSRIMRLPGTINQKRNRKMCEVIVSSIGASYDVAEFPEVLGETLELAGYAEGTRTLEDFAPSTKTLEFINGKVKPGERNNTLFSAACEFSANGIAWVEAEKILTTAALRCGLSLDEASQAIRSGYSKPRTIKVTAPDAGTIMDSIAQNVAATFADAEPEPVKPTRATGEAAPCTSQADPQDAPRTIPIISNGWKGTIVDEGGKAKTINYVRPIVEIGEHILKTCDGWPKAVGDALFVLDKIANKPRVRYMNKTQELFAWLQAKSYTLWIEGEGRIRGVAGAAGWQTAATKSEILEHLIKTVPDRYIAVSELPHEPAMPGMFYVPIELPPATGQYLDEFVSMFNVASEDDRLLLKAAVCTPAWGGAPGTRPGFLFEADGPGAGKTATVFAIARVYNGAHLVSDPKMPWNETLKQMFSGPSAAARMLVFDNAKEVVEGQAIEAAITAPTISGWKAYFGTIQRPNDLTVMITSNNAQTSADMAQRVVVIRMGEPKKGIDWQARMDAFLAEHRLDVLADVLALLKAAPKYRPDQILGDRFSGWQRAILAKIDGADRLSKTIFDRREAVDADSKRGEEIARLIYELAIARAGASRYFDLPAYTLWRRLCDVGYWTNERRLDVDAKSIADCSKWAQRKVARWSGLLTGVKTDSGEVRRVMTPRESGGDGAAVKSAILRFDLNVFERHFKPEDMPITDRYGNEIPI